MGNSTKILTYIGVGFLISLQINALATKQIISTQNKIQNKLQQDTQQQMITDISNLQYEYKKDICEYVYNINIRNMEQNNLLFKIREDIELEQQK
jgi:hypothetical protein